MSVESWVKLVNQRSNAVFERTGTWENYGYPKLRLNKSALIRNGVGHAGHRDQRSWNALSSP